MKKPSRIKLIAFAVTLVFIAGCRDNEIHTVNMSVTCRGCNISYSDYEGHITYLTIEKEWTRTIQVMSGSGIYLSADRVSHDFDFEADTIILSVKADNLAPMVETEKGYLIRMSLYYPVPD
jgi:hypothetical protein